MKRKIRIGIIGYGNLGKGSELAVQKNPDMELIGIFSRRDLTTSLTGTRTVKISDIRSFQDKVDVMILCGGSATDLMEQGPQISSLFHTVDSFDTHARIPEYFVAMEQATKLSGKVATISVGWDPGLFSLTRLLSNAVLPDGKDYTFWGKGVSQGHSEAIRHIPGVRNAKQYTIPKQKALEAVRSKKYPVIHSQQAHTRVCYVVPEPTADLKSIETTIKTMPHYFDGYDTLVSFISEEEFQKNHKDMPHGGSVIRCGYTSPGVNHVMELTLKLDSNPEFTASVLVAYARATFRLAQNGAHGTFTIFDIPLSYLSHQTPAELRKILL